MLIAIFQEYTLTLHHARSISDSETQEIEPYDKTVNFLLYDEETFVKYCNGDVGTCARKTELAVFDKEEERQRVQEIQKQRQECERAEMEKVRERAARKARGEVSESDSGSEEDDRDADSDEDFY